MKFRTVTGALALLLGASMTEKAAAFGGLADADSAELIELDINIKHQPKNHLNMVGMHLMNLQSRNQ